MSKHYIVLFLNYFVNTFCFIFKRTLSFKDIKIWHSYLIKIGIERKIPSNKRKYFKGYFYSFVQPFIKYMCTFYVWMNVFTYRYICIEILCLLCEFVLFIHLMAEEVVYMDNHEHFTPQSTSRFGTHFKNEKICSCLCKPFISEMMIL